MKKRSYIHSLLKVIASLAFTAVFVIGCQSSKLTPDTTWRSEILVEEWGPYFVEVILRADQTFVYTIILESENPLPGKPRLTYSGRYEVDDDGTIEFHVISHEEDLSIADRFSGKLLNSGNSLELGNGDRVMLTRREESR